MDSKKKVRVQEVHLDVFLGLSPIEGRERSRVGQGEKSDCNVVSGRSQAMKSSETEKTLQSCPELEEEAWVTLKRKYVFGKTTFLSQGNPQRGLTPEITCQQQP